MFDRFNTLPLISSHTHKSLAKWSKRSPLHSDLWAFNQADVPHKLSPNLHPFYWDCGAVGGVGMGYGSWHCWDEKGTRNYKGHKHSPLCLSMTLVVFCQWYDYIDLGGVLHDCIYHSLNVVSWLMHPGIINAVSEFNVTHSKIGVMS